MIGFLDPDILMLSCLGVRPYPTSFLVLQVDINHPDACQIIAGFKQVAIVSE